MKNNKTFCIRTEAKKENEKGDNCQIQLAKYVSLIYHNKLWKTWGFLSFTEYGEKELNKSYRSLMNLKVCGDVISRLNLSQNDITKVGMSIFKEIASYSEAKNLKLNETLKIIDEIYKQKMSYTKAREYLRNKRLKNKKTINLNIRFMEDQYNCIIKPCLEKAKLLTQNNHIRFNIEYIMMDWIMNRNPETLDKIIEYIQNKRLKK